MQAKALVPRKYRSSLGIALRTVQHLGVQVKCPCCGWHFRRFLPFGVVERANASCPKCGSLERHRVLWLYLKNKTDFFARNHRVLHVAPERVFAAIFRRMPRLRYIAADLASKLANIRMDITAIPYKDNSFDVVLCNHVLEHVVEDQKAIGELFRVLVPGGWAILQCPVDPQRAKTFEDPQIISPQDRERAFGQQDHVRIYGRDYKERLEKAGFTVKVDNYVRDLDVNIVRKYGLKDEDIHFCTKPLLRPKSLDMNFFPLKEDSSLVSV
jgi:SAM-dependent methyltransferase